MKIKLSGVIITFNEEEKIGQCIDSLLNVCDEILVVDSFSTDKTKEICKKAIEKVNLTSYWEPLTKKYNQTTRTIYIAPLEISFPKAFSSSKNSDMCIASLKDGTNIKIELNRRINPKINNIIVSEFKNA